LPPKREEWPIMAEYMQLWIGAQRGTFLLVTHEVLTPLAVISTEAFLWGLINFPAGSIAFLHHLSCRVIAANSLQQNCPWHGPCFLGG